ncbi:GATA zinc finger domain-containing protein 14-like [Rhopalosiphum maidis]|uniref:GATA zinc finger domain-containing protein 14-like n=1 Tax=Rhopalosiphum maidis TaxID=43146 RepID=UPI000EFF331A|nr:GATA zinc finger domain-containing protein 14-like [Rhopalosiphum maidis]
MIFQLIILTTTLLLAQVKCRTYIPEKYSVDDNLNRQQTYQRTYEPTEQQRRIVYVDKRQYPNEWNENIMKGDRSPIIFTDKAPVTINYKGGRGGLEQSLYGGFRKSCPIVLTSQGEITVNYDGLQNDDDVPPNNQDICMMLTKTMVELPSGIVMPYLKFKTISSYLSENQKSDIRIILDHKNMTYKQFQETLRYHGCGDLEDSSQSSGVDLTNYVTLANGTQVEMDDYRNIVSSITSGSETLLVPNVVNGKYSLYRSLIADELPEMIPSTFVITHAGIVVPFSLYYAVDTEHFQRPTTAVVPRIRQIKWRDGKLVDVQTIRQVIDALKTPTMIIFVFPNGKRMPFVKSDVNESTELYDYDPEKVVVDVGQSKNILLLHFNDIVFAVHIHDDRGDGKYKRFNPPVFGLDPKCMNSATSTQTDGKVCCDKSNKIDDGSYSGYSIHAINKDKRRGDDKPSDKQLTVFGPISAMEKTTGLDSNDSIRIILTSSSGTHEIKITNVLDNKKPLIYDINDKPANVRDLVNIISQNECDYSPIIINKMNISNMTNTTNLPSNNCTNILRTYIECDCKLILKNNETNSMIDVKNTPDLKDPSNLNESTKNQTITECNKNSTTNNNKNQTETVVTTTVTQNNTELTNTTINPNACGKINNTTIENEKNSAITSDCTENHTNNQQNNCRPVIGDDEIPITKNTTTTNSNNRQNSSDPIAGYKEVPTVNDCNQNQTETKNTTINPDYTKNTTSSNTTNTDKTCEPSTTNDGTGTTETGNNTSPNPKNNQNSSNPGIESNTIPITKDDNNQTETKNTTTVNNSPNITANVTGSNDTDTDKKYEPDRTDHGTVTTETRDETITDPDHTAVATENAQDGYNPVIATNETPITNTNDYQSSTETINKTASAPNYRENTNSPNSSGTDDDTYTGSKEAPGVINTAETTIHTPETTIASDANDVGPTENPDTIPETNTGINDNESAEVYNITTTGVAEPTQSTPVYTETITTPNNGSVTNNATKIVNIIVY